MTTTKSMIKNTDVRNLIETARDKGCFFWTAKLPYTVDMVQEVIIVKTEGGLKAIRMQELIMEPEFMKAVAGSQEYLLQRYKKGLWTNFVHALITQEER